MIKSKHYVDHPDTYHALLNQMMNRIGEEDRLISDF